MYCNNCGKHNHENSKFCQYCGTKLVKQVDDEEKSKKEEETKQEEKKTDTLWDKFVEVYDAKDEDRKKFDSVSSPYIWELIERLAVNGFEGFLQDEEIKKEFNKQPYKTLEALKTYYTWCVLGGYRLWLSEALLDDKEELNKFKSFSLDKFIEAWKEYDFDKAMKELSEEMGIAITRYSSFRLEGFMDSAPEAKNLPNALVEQLRTSLLLETVNGYHAGKIENTFRK